MLNKQGDTALESNVLLASVPKLGKEYYISFDVKPNSFVNEWQSVLHFTSDNTNIDSYGSRAPGIWFHHLTSTLHICSALNGGKNTCYNAAGFTIGKWTNVQIYQNQVDGGFKYQIKIDGDIVKSLDNNDAREFSNVQVYAADPWYTAADADIRNVVMSATPADTPACVWRDWLDRDNPGTSGDWEVCSRAGHLKGHTCPGSFMGCNFSKIQIRVKGQDAIYTTAEEVKSATGDNVLITKAGFVCKMADQDDNTCADYEVKICCDSE